ncbi:phage tail tape measure protein [[Ruminococcus] gnavus]|uniref:Phage tail tape measure protein n=2 Tax=Mediterraneibacter gnavus TaxID=33038 RepID=A0AAJ1ENB9_MEDGN|nr:phage tail tape measure protein [Mediterraneibacter gnavus]MCC3675482.1 phage tail tape measure protein [[Clostridium] nexile]MCB5492739.1 phage tail tape measure protein [Mediterraneibacter gnavus]MCB5605070.1 phage tail tape measure protein [Mediterraneibacter gnavus]MCG4522157.1 phage tail tape measure protein [Mediterraneibacter gnavus]NSC88403.1 phage tail tape measure protein [Mediterraneibacter gnavus]
MATKVIKIEIPIETKDNTGPVVDSISEKMENLDSAAKKAQKSMENTVNSANKAAKGFENASRRVSGFEKSVGSGFDSASKKASGFEKSVNKTQKSLLAMMKEKYQLLLEAKDRITPTVKQAITYVKSLTGKTWKVTLKAVDLVTSPVRRVFGLLKSPLVAAGVTISAGAGIADTVQTYADFEAAMSEVKAISGATSQEFEQLTEKANQMGAVTKFTASESAEAFKYMAQAGWDVREMMDGIDGLMALAAASGEDLGITADIVTDALTAFGLSAKESGRFADVMAQAASATNTDVAKMGDTFKYVAPVAGALGYSIEDTAVAIGLMANSGIKASQAGTSLRSLLTNLTRPVGQAEDAINALGISITNTDGSVKPLSQTLQDLRAKFGALTDSEKAQYAAMLAGQEGMSGLLAIVNASDQEFESLTEQINNSSGAAQKMADVMMDNLSGKFELFTGALDSMKMSLGEKFKPYLIEALEWMTDKVPDVENALLTAMNSFDHFVDNAKAKIDEFTATDEWKNADLFGKIEIAWDELVAEPFSDWWNGSGKLKVAGVARDIGTGIGSAISAGILALMGVDVSSVIDEGSSIGRQFAEGFSEGMSGVDVSAALGTMVSGAFSSAGKLLPGGAAPDIGSLLSAAAIAKIAGPLISFGSGAFKVGKGVYKSATGGVLKNIIGSASVADELAGVGTMTGTGLAGGLAKIGANLGGASIASTGTGLALAGAGAVAGGVVGGSAIISGGMDAFDAYNSYKEGNKEAAKAQGASAGLKVGGVAAGAAIGTAILPGIGTLIGAGIGGLAGWFAGDKVKEDYEEAAVAAENLEQKSKYALEGAKFDSKELKEAFDDTNVSAEQFGAMMQEATSNKIRDAFGDIKLTMQEIEEAAKQIVFADQAEALNKFSAAAETADSSLATLQSSFQTMDKLNWKASLGMELDEGDMSEYISAVDAMIESSKQYLEDKHYEATAAIDLLIELGNETDMTSGLNQMYSDLQTKIESLGGDLKAKVNVALEDGVITLDEQAEIANLQNQIADITNQISQAETEASFQSLKIKYSGASLDADSFASLVSEIQANVQNAASQYDEALQVSLTNLNLQLQNGAISQKQFDEQLQALTEGYQAKITDLSVRVESFELQSIADSFGSELDGILPELEGSVAERLGTAMHNAMANGIDATQWSMEGEGLKSAIEALDLGDLEASTQSAVAEMMGQVARSLPEQMTSALQDSGVDMSESVNNILKSGIENADLSDTGTAITQKLGESISAVDMSESSAGLQEGLQSSLMASVENIDLMEAGSLMNQKLGEAMSSVDMSESDAGLQEGLQNSLTASLENIDLTEVGGMMNQKLGEAMASVDMSESGTGLQEGLQNSLTAALEGIDLSESAQMINTSIVTALSSTEGIDMSGFTASMQSSITSSIEGLDYSGVTTAVGSGISNAITATMGTIQGAIDTLYSNVGSAINTAFSAGFSTTTTVTITANYKLANPSATISFSGGGTGTATVSGSISSHANGGFAYGPELTWWGEDGPEVIIPLGSKRRQRGLELWAQAGEMLGVGKHADGGIIGSGGGTSKNIWDNTERLIEPISEGDSGTSDVSTVIDSERNSDTKEVNLSVTVNPQFVISSTSQREDDILQIIKTHMKELADDLGGELADRLGEVFSNMPISS